MHVLAVYWWMNIKVACFSTNTVATHITQCMKVLKNVFIETGYETFHLCALKMIYLRISFNPGQAFAL